MPSAALELRLLWRLHGVWFAIRCGRLCMAPQPGDKVDDVAAMREIIDSWSEHVHV